MSGSLLYLHGFCSAPQSRKAQALRAYMSERGLGESFACPQLPPSPREAIALVEGLIAAASEPLTLIGSSLGGYYATWLTERYPEAVAGTVLVNPSVVAHLSLEQFIGPQINLYSGERFDFTAAHVEELRALEVPHLARLERYWLLAEEGDEVLDYRLAVAKYAGARQTVLPGGDHGFTRWPEYLDAILVFAGYSVSRSHSCIPYAPP